MGRVPHDSRVKHAGGCALVAEDSATHAAGIEGDWTGGEVGRVVGIEQLA